MQRRRLAHAARKPVVFTSANLEDVPFDLRHLRVVIYDIHDPRWGEKLKVNLTAFLKNAKADPTKSIPQPFRAHADAEIAHPTSRLAVPASPVYS